MSKYEIITHQRTALSRYDLKLHFNQMMKVITYVVSFTVLLCCSQYTYKEL